MPDIDFYLDKSRSLKATPTKSAKTIKKRPPDVKSFIKKTSTASVETSTDNIKKKYAAILNRAVLCLLKCE